MDYQWNLCGLLHCRRAYRRERNGWDILSSTSAYLHFFFVLFCFVLFCFVLFCFVLFCFVLFCFVLFCFVLFCFFVLFCLLCLFSILLLFLLYLTLTVLNISMILIERTMPGVKTRAMKCSGMWGSGTAYPIFNRFIYLSYSLFFFFFLVFVLREMSLETGCVSYGLN